MQITLEQAEELLRGTLHIRYRKLACGNFTLQEVGKHALQGLRAGLPEFLRQFRRTAGTRGQQAMQGDGCLAGDQREERLRNRDQLITQ